MAAPEKERKSQAGVRVSPRLGPGERLKAKADHERVRRDGRRGGDAVLRVLVARNGLEWSRLAAAIPRRHGPAVVRNRLRRLYGEAFRMEKDTLPKGVDVVAGPPNGGGVPTLDAVRASLVRLVTQAAARLRPFEPAPPAPPVAGAP